MMQGTMDRISLVLVGLMLGLAVWPVAERFKIVPPYCVVDDGIYDAMTAGNR